MDSPLVIKKKNGSRAGDEVVQIYLRNVLSSATTYEKNLVGFERNEINKDLIMDGDYVADLHITMLQGNAVISEVKIPMLKN